MAARRSAGASASSANPPPAGNRLAYTRSPGWTPAPVAGRFDDSGDLLTRDERQGKPREAAAEEPDVPQADTCAMDSDRCLSRRRVLELAVHSAPAIDPAQLLRQRYARGSALLTLCSCGPPVPVRAPPPPWVLPADNAATGT